LIFKIHKIIFNTLLTTPQNPCMYFCADSVSMKYLFSAILVFLIISCESTDKKHATYFGGHIVNPKSNFVLLLKDQKVIDKIELDSNNRFLHSYDDIDEGLYTFKHGNEFQYIYMEPADSILIRLNTWDFDESLVFSGKGGNKNNYLINSWLENEKSERSWYKLFKLKENQFEEKIEQMIRKRNGVFEDFSLNETELSDKFKKFSEAVILLPIYRLKEIYPYYHKKQNRLDDFPSLSNDFYKYRGEINFSNEDLISFHPYQNYLVSYLYNQAFQLDYNDKDEEDNLTIHLLNVTEEKIVLQDLKNTILKTIVVEDFLNAATTCTINEEVLDLFIKYCTDEHYIKQVQDLVNDTKTIQENNSLPNFEVISYTNEVNDISELIKNKNSVIYFWSTQFLLPDKLLSRVKSLEKKFPDIQFIGINLQTNEDITKDPYLKKLNINNQFKLTEESQAYDFLTSHYPRTIIVNDEGRVTNGFTLINSKNIWSEIKKLEKK